MSRPIVAIVGRPNVGKSSLFNRLLGRRLAITEDIPGTTRDRLYADLEWRDRAFTLVDTGGLDLDSEAGIPAAVRAQAQLAINEADVVLFVVDTRSGISPVDAEVANVLRKTAKPLLVVANKAENVSREMAAMEFFELGFDDVLPVSAYHGIGGDDLLDWIVAHLPEATADLAASSGEEIRVAIVGRPNVGKSSMLNKLLGEERVLVSETPGTTRDATDTVLERDGRRYRLIDTAGIRRRGRIVHGAAEQYSVIRALRALAQCDVAVLLVDAVEGMTDGDLHIAGYAQQEAKGLVVVVNKWDLVERQSGTAEAYARAIHARLDFMPYVPVLFASALTGFRVGRVLDEAARVWNERHRRVGTADLNAFVESATLRHPATHRGKVMRVLYATQAEVNPPTFVFFVNDAELAHFGYRRFLENELRHAFGFAGTPLKLVFRGRQEDAVGSTHARRLRG